MRLWHLLALVAAAAVALALIRAELGLVVLVWIMLFLVMNWRKTPDRWIQRELLGRQLPNRKMLVLAGAALFATGLAFTLKFAVDHLSR